VLGQRDYANNFDARATLENLWGLGSASGSARLHLNPAQPQTLRARRINSSPDLQRRDLLRLRTD